MRPMVAVCVLAFSGAAMVAVAQPLTLDERVAARRAVEEVYWKHRIWPAENPGPKPPLEAVLPDAVLRAMVEDELRNSPELSTEQLQAEVDRMVARSRAPGILAELFDALGNDPNLIAETLARPALASASAAASLEASEARIELPLLDPNAGGCSDDLWRDLESAPSSRADTSAVWTGSEMIVWGGDIGSIYRNTGGRYTPATDRWTPMSRTGAPTPRSEVRAVWTGTRMIVWGGTNGTVLRDGAVYDPVADAWTTMSTVGAPVGGNRNTAVWTGARMLVWGGRQTTGAATNQGASYDPGTNTWTAITTTGAPTAREGHTAVWTGTLMVVWGGVSSYTGNAALATGGRYDPSTNTWTATATTGAPTARRLHTAVWAPERGEMLVWGGYGSAYTNSGARYDPGSNTWSSFTTSGAPVARGSHAAAWTGSRLVIWGGTPRTPTGGQYDPATDTWTATSTAGAPTPRDLMGYVWAPEIGQLLVWGGTAPGYLGSGGRYSPAGDTWTPISGNVAQARTNHVGVWTGVEMVVWGGEGATGSLLADGARYFLATDTWAPIAASPLAGRHLATSVWTGTEMIVWGGAATGGVTNTGGRYNPASNSWTLTTTTGAPTGRTYHTAVWTGSQMIVWGGGSAGAGLNSGSRYTPATNTWTATATTAGVPSARTRHVAVWTGSRMLIWSGWNGTSFFNNGSRYDPVANTWSAMTSTGAPGARVDATAVWTGSQMIVFGGCPNTSCSPLVNSGGRYDPVANIWAATTTTGAPTARRWPAAVWNGVEMIVWSGLTSGSSITTDTGARYDPAGNVWTTIAVSDRTPVGRRNSTAFWTGSEMLVFGGMSNAVEWADGGRYCGCTLFYRDADGDGHGDPADSADSCDGTVPPGYVASGDDCDDADPTNFPGNIELCDGRDNDCNGTVEVPGPESCNGRDDDCNGLVDEGNPGGGGACSTGQPGACSSGTQVCSLGALACEPAGGPGPELCNGIDDDCDGATDEATDSDLDLVGDCLDNCPDASNPDQTNGDGDTFGDVCDCAPTEPGNGRAPAVSNTLRLTRSGTTTNLVWQDDGIPGPFRLYRGYRNPGSGFSYTHVCTGPAWPGTTATDVLVPRPGTLFYYLVSREGCLESALGFGTFVGEIPNADPCPSVGTDADGDGQEEAVDNCPGFSNGSQADADADQHGDVCDNCPVGANPGQEDLDTDGLGDVCDADRDGDGVANGADNCPDLVNPGQDNLDLDPLGDACDPDADGDDILEDGDGSGTPGDATCTAGETEGCDDNCPVDANANQADGDGDGTGDVCDATP